MCLVRRPLVARELLELFLRQCEDCVARTQCPMCRAEADYLRSQIQEWTTRLSGTAVVGPSPTC